jgi:hypothetical protein
MLIHMIKQLNNKQFTRLNNRIFYGMIKRYFPGGKEVVKFNALFNTNTVMNSINKNKNTLVPTYPLLSRPNSINIITRPSKIIRPMIVHESYKSIFLEKSLEMKNTENIVNIFTLLKKISNINSEKNLSVNLEKDGLPSSINALKDYLRNLDKKEDLTDEDKNILVKSKNFIMHNTISPNDYPSPITRDLEEYERFCNETAMVVTNDIIKDLKEFFKLEKLSRCFTSENFNYELERNKKGLEILKQHQDKLTEAQFLEVLRRAGVIINPDAIFNKDNSYAESPSTKTITIKEGEGPKFDSRVYKTIIEHSLFKKERGEYPNVAKILATMEKSDIIIGTIERMPTANTLLLSGYDLHMVVAIPDPDNPDYYLICAMLTSTKDKETVILSNNQYDNPNESKVQMIRFSKQLIRIPKNQIKEKAEIKDHFEKTSNDGQNIMDKIKNGIKDNSGIFCEEIIEELKDYTKEELLIIAVKFYEDNINELTLGSESLHKTLAKLSFERRALRVEELKKQEKNFLNDQKKTAYISSLPEELKILFQIKDRLEYLAKRSKLKLKEDLINENKLKYASRKDSNKVTEQNLNKDNEDTN